MDFKRASFRVLFLSIILCSLIKNSLLEGLILAQSERWRRGLGMQVERSRRDELLELSEVSVSGMEERDGREFFVIAAKG